MARKLSGIATYGTILFAILVALAVAPRAEAQSDVQVTPATDLVDNPYAPRPRVPQSRSVPHDADGVPKTYQNPFATRSAPLRVLTPLPNYGSLSRWRRQVDGEDAGAATCTEPTVGENWDGLTPEASDPQNTPEPLELIAPTRSQNAAPPDPVRFAPSALHQPYWLLPDPTTGENAASNSVVAARLPDPQPQAAEPGAAEPFDEQSDAAVMVSDSPSPMPDTQDPAECYAQAEQAAAAATTVEELGSVVRLCEAGLSGRPQGELAKSLRTLAAWASNRRGELKSDDRREDEALREFEIAIQFDPNCALALHNRGVSRAQQGNADGALDDFNRAIDLNPGLAVAYRNRGELLAAKGRSEEAVADYGRTLAQLPDDADVLVMRGHALHRLGRYQESLADLSRAIELAPKNAEAFANRGNVLAELGEFPRAIKDFDQALRLDPESPGACRSLAWLLATCPDPRFRNPQKALATAQRAEQLSPPGDCFVLDALAAAHANAGYFDQAVRYQKEAVATAPDDFRQTFAARLALYEHRRPFRNGTFRAADRDVRAASLETRERQQ